MEPSRADMMTERQSYLTLLVDSVQDGYDDCMTVGRSCWTLLGYSRPA